jgi:hypothetical protein
MHNIHADLQSVGHKPIGFLVSVQDKDDWFNWCMEEEFCTYRLAIRHEVEIDFSSILVIDTPEKLEAFQDKYSAHNYFNTFIHWPRVASKYSEIIIAPYFQKYAREYIWYFGWDCASGCLWAAKDVVKKINSACLEVECA